MDKSEKKNYQEEQLILCNNEINRLVTAIKLLNEKYKETLSDYEAQLELAKYRKEIFEKIL